MDKLSDFEYGFESDKDAYDKLEDKMYYMVYNNETGWQEMKYEQSFLNNPWATDATEHSFIFTKSIENSDNGGTYAIYGWRADVTFNWIVTKEEYRKAKLDYLLE